MGRWRCALFNRIWLFQTDVCYIFILRICLLYVFLRSFFISDVYLNSFLKEIIFLYHQLENYLRRLFTFYQHQQIGYVSYIESLGCVLFQLKYLLVLLVPSHFSPTWDWLIWQPNYGLRWSLMQNIQWSPIGGNDPVIADLPPAKYYMRSGCYWKQAAKIFIQLKSVIKTCQRQLKFNS